MSRETPGSRISELLTHCMSQSQISYPEDMHPCLFLKGTGPSSHTHLSRARTPPEQGKRREKFTQNSQPLRKKDRFLSLMKCPVYLNLILTAFQEGGACIVPTLQTLNSTQLNHLSLARLCCISLSNHSMSIHLTIYTTGSQRPPGTFPWSPQASFSTGSQINVWGCARLWSLSTLMIQLLHYIISSFWGL
jgi:hypothetical protein